MAGRGDDSAPAPPAGSTARRVERPPSGRGTVALGTGLLLAAGATVAAFSTDDPRYLRIAVLAACWAFLVAAFVAGGQQPDQVATDGREAELHRADQPPGEVEDGMRRELAALRAEIAALAGLRENVAALGEVRGELAALGQLRAELGQLRGQLSGELLIERTVLRGHGPSSAGARPPWNRRPADDDEPVRLIASPPKPPIEWPAEEPPAWALDEPSWKRAQDLPAAEQAPSRLSGERADAPSPSVHGAAPAQDAGHDRLARILAESGVDAGGRRHRRRAAEEAAGQPGDDVLSRVLGRR